MKLNKSSFEGTIGGKETGLYFISNKNGIEIAITNYGARIVALMVPDKNNTPVDVVVGFDSLQGYLDAFEPFHGAIVGRYANRIARGRFSLGGKEYQLSINNPPNHLHGGPNGFHNQVWQLQQAEASFLRLSYFSPDGEENYPGNLHVLLTYTISDENELAIHYLARTDAMTIFNITSHPFFNLNGQGTGSITDHLLQVHASHYNPVDSSLIPLGIFPVKDTPFDFLEPKKIGRDIGQDHEQLKFGAGYDHNFVLDGAGMRQAARAVGNRTGIIMEAITDQPGIQLYTGNYMKGEHRIKYGLRDQFRGAFCLETQHFPDSPNHPAFPSTVLESGTVFRSATSYRFGL